MINTSVVFSVTVNLVFVDESNNPIDATNSIKILEDKSTQEELARNGFTASNTGLKPLVTRPEKKNCK